MGKEVLDVLKKYVNIVNEWDWDVAKIWIPYAVKSRSLIMIKKSLSCRDRKKISRIIEKRVPRIIII